MSSRSLSTLLHRLYKDPLYSVDLLNYVPNIRNPVFQIGCGGDYFIKRFCGSRKIFRTVSLE